MATTDTATGQQWDFPNAWPPLQHLLVAGAATAGGAELAEDLARRFLETLANAWQSSGEMHEKFDVREAARDVRGGGGEYMPQVGFGWTNGVALILLDNWGAKHEGDDC